MNYPPYLPFEITESMFWQPLVFKIISDDFKYKSITLHRTITWYMSNAGNSMTTSVRGEFDEEFEFYGTKHFVGWVGGNFPNVDDPVWLLIKKGSKILATEKTFREIEEIWNDTRGI